MKTKYQIFDSIVDRPLHKVTRAEARRHFQHFIESIPFRIEALQSLVADVGIKLDFSEESIDMLDEWFPTVVSAQKKEDGTTVPSDETFSICNDLGMYLGEMLRCSSPNMKWHFVTDDKRNIAYQRPVILICPKNPKYHNFEIDFDDGLCRYAYRLVRGKPIEPRFIRGIFDNIKEWL